MLAWTCRERDQSTDNSETSFWRNWIHNCNKGQATKDLIFENAHKGENALIYSSGSKERKESTFINSEHCAMTQLGKQKVREVN